jgi:hypothetical protein
MERLAKERRGLTTHLPVTLKKEIVMEVTAEKLAQQIVRNRLGWTIEDEVEDALEDLGVTLIKGDIIRKAEELAREALDTMRAEYELQLFTNTQLYGDLNE